jgi:protein gp37
MAQRLKGRYGYSLKDPFTPTFHPNRLGEPYYRKKPTRIFTVSMGDMFSPGVDPDWIHQILTVIDGNPQHTFQILTQFPYNILSLINTDKLPDNIWLGVTVQNNKNKYRIPVLSGLKNVIGGKWKTFISFEPLHGSIRHLDLRNIDWIIIGAETGNRKGRIKPEKQWVDDIIMNAGPIPIYLKENLLQYYSIVRKDFPV